MCASDCHAPTLSGLLLLIVISRLCICRVIGEAVLLSELVVDCEAIWVICDGYINCVCVRVNEFLSFTLELV